VRDAKAVVFDPEFAATLTTSLRLAADDPRPLRDALSPGGGCLMSRHLDGIRRMIASTPWAMLPEYIEAMLDVLELRATGVRLSDAEIAARIAAAEHPFAAAAGKLERIRRGRKNVGAVAVLPLYGIIAQKASMVSNVSGPRAPLRKDSARRSTLRSATTTSRAIVIDVNSPGRIGRRRRRALDEDLQGARHEADRRGGEHHGRECRVLHRERRGRVRGDPIRERRLDRRLHRAHDLSAAMSARALSKRSSALGSTRRRRIPRSRSDRRGARVALQERVDEAYGMFVNAVARNRGVNARRRPERIRTGRLLGAKKARSRPASSIASRHSTR
jgi:hypothetical protein